MRDEFGYHKPPGTTWNYDVPKEGDAVYFQGRAARVMHVAKRETDGGDEYVVTLRRLYGPKFERENSANDAAFCAGRPAWRGIHSYVNENRVPLCSCHGHPYPCREQRIEEYTEQQAELMETRLRRVGPSICYACGEVITTRQGSVAFPEANIEVPAAPPPRFHTRRKCYGAAIAYERKRRKSPDREPVLDGHFGGIG